MPRTVLRDWLGSRGLTVAQFAAVVGRPVKTVEDWAYGRGEPSGQNRAFVYLITGLEAFGPRTSKEREQIDILRHELERKVELKVRELGGLIEALKGILDFFEAGPEWWRERLREGIDLQDAALVSNFLRAMLSEERLENWRMTAQVSKGLAGGRTGHA